MKQVWKKVRMMKVKVGPRIYRMNRKEYQEFLEVAKEQVPMGVYALKKNDYAEVRNDACTSKTKLKDMIRIFKSQGFKVYANGR